MTSGPQDIDAEWWAEWEYFQGLDENGTPKIFFRRKRILRLKGINQGRFMFELYPSKIWVLYTPEEVKSLYDRRVLREFVIKGGKYEAPS